MRKYEYKIVIGKNVFMLQVDDNVLNDESMLSNLGKEGWELVSVIYPVKAGGIGSSVKIALYYLKREIKDK